MDEELTGDPRLEHGEEGEKWRLCGLILGSALLLSKRYVDTDIHQGLQNESEKKNASMLLQSRDSF